jgi:drug/metabolite transporter (DMT)-like permease
MTGWTRAERRAAGAVALAALGFALISIWTIVATRDGMALSLFLLVRFVVATVVLAPFVRRDPSPAPGSAVDARIMALGAVGQTLVAVLSLGALAWIPAAALVALFYTFPAWITLGAAWRGTERLTLARGIALALSLVGVACLVGWPGRAALHPWGVALGLGAAVIYAIYVPLMSRVMVGVPALRATWLVTAGVSLVFLVGTPALGDLTFGATPAAWGAAIATGVFSTAVALLLFLRGLSTLGPVRTSIVSTVEPIFAALLAAAIVGQPITLPMIVGGSLITAAGVVLSLGDARRAR